MKQTLVLCTILFLLVYGYIYLSKFENTPKQKALLEKRKGERLDTLIAKFVCNTGSLDLYYLQGPLTIPKDIKVQLQDTLGGDIRICGNFPKDLIDMTSWNYDPYLSFKIIGKIINAEIEYETEKVPLFYVIEWEKFYYDCESWMEKGDLGTYSNRAKMVNGIVKNMKFEGQSIKEMLLLFGTPDYESNGEIVYKIDEEYGTDIDPISSKILKIAFNEDSIVTNKSIDVWEKQSN